MFIGHFALGFAARRATPRVPLVVLFAAAQFADLLWPVFLALGLEQVRIAPGSTVFTPLDFVSYPYSHSLVTLLAWGAAFGILYTRRSGHRPTAIVIAALVVSHWVLDFVTHRPDMPLYPGGPKFGLGLWNSVPATVAIEVPMYAVGTWIYFRSTRARDRTGRWAMAAFVLFLLVAYAGNIVSSPPPSVPVLYVSAMAGFVVLMLWSWWADRHREPVAGL